MCIVKRPKITQSAAADDKDPPVLRNPFLDGVDPIIRARQSGLKALRIDRAPMTTTSPSTLRIAR